MLTRSIDYATVSGASSSKGDAILLKRRVSN
jgi:hypothetical protein